MGRQPKFQCLQCGECCGVPVFFEMFNTYEIVEKISEKFNVEFIEINHGKMGMAKLPLTSNAQLKLVRTGELPKADCPFLGNTDDGKCKCLIYEDRPVICRTFGPSKAPAFRCHRNYPTKSNTR